MATSASSSSTAPLTISNSKPDLTRVERCKLRSAVTTVGAMKYEGSGKSLWPNTFGATLRLILDQELQKKYDVFSKKTIGMHPKERCFLLLGGVQPRCTNPNCFQVVTTFSTARNVYKPYCSLSCARVDCRKHLERSIKNKYGVDNVMEIQGVRQKISRAVTQNHIDMGHTQKLRNKYVVPDRSFAKASKSKAEYYVYVLLDPRKPGTFKYGPWSFEYEPFYVGKGLGGRVYHHLAEVLKVRQSSNPHRVGKINKIIRETGDYPKFSIKRSGLSEYDALILESKLIKQIGRSDMREGPLTNLTDGGEGSCNSKWTRKRRREQSIRIKEAISKTAPENRPGRKNKKTDTEWKAELRVAQPNIKALDEYEGCYYMMRFECTTCRHSWEGRASVVKCNGCLKCKSLDPVRNEEKRLRNSEAAKRQHAERTERQKRSIYKKISKAQVEAWKSPDHAFKHHTSERKAITSERKSKSIQAYFDNRKAA